MSTTSLEEFSLKTPRKTNARPRDYLALAIATWGVGYLPLMPGRGGRWSASASFSRSLESRIVLVLVAIPYYHSALVSGPVRGPRS